MPYLLEYNTELEFIDLRYSGTIALDERKQARDQVFALAREKNIVRTLVDMTQSNIVMSEEERIKFASAFGAAGLPANYHLACVIRLGDASENLVELMISMDGINVRYFNSREEAIEWLTAF